MNKQEEIYWVTQFKPLKGSNTVQTIITQIKLKLKNKLVVFPPSVAAALTMMPRQWLIISIVEVGIEGTGGGSFEPGISGFGTSLHWNYWRRNRGGLLWWWCGLFVRGSLIFVPPSRLIRIRGARRRTATAVSGLFDWEVRGKLLRLPNFCCAFKDGKDFGRNGIERHLLDQQNDEFHLYHGESGKTWTVKFQVNQRV